MAWRRFAAALVLVWAASASAHGGEAKEVDGRLSRASFEDWDYWYNLNDAGIEDFRLHLYRRWGPSGAGPDPDPVGVRARMRWTAKLTRALALPALLAATDPDFGGGVDTEAAAWISLARVTQDPAHIDLLLAGLAGGRDRPLVVQEGAALGLGLLRRAQADDQFPAAALDRVRSFLFDVFEDETRPVRTRGFAVVSIGLLGDQPTESGARRTTIRLFDLLRRPYDEVDLPVGLVTAIGLQPSESHVPEERRELAALALADGSRSHDAKTATRAHAAIALARVGTADEVRAFEAMLAPEDVPTGVQRSGAIGLGVLARRLPADLRVRASRVLLHGIGHSGDASTRNFALISLARLLCADVLDGATHVLVNTAAAEVLLDVVTDGERSARGFAALSLGLVLREISDELAIDAWQAFRERALLLLRRELARPDVELKTRAAVVLALGIAQDLRSREPLRKLVADSTQGGYVRGYAARALGLIDSPSRDVVKTLAAALMDPTPPSVRRQAALALGLLGSPRLPGDDRTAVGRLLARFETAETVGEMGELFLALGRIGDHDAVAPLVDILRDPRQRDLTRAIACSVLGQVGDLERMPSLDRLRRDVNYRAGTSLTNELLSIH